MKKFIKTTLLIWLIGYGLICTYELAVDWQDHYFDTSEKRCWSEGGAYDPHHVRWSWDAFTWSPSSLGFEQWYQCMGSDWRRDYWYIDFNEPEDRERVKSMLE